VAGLGAACALLLVSAAPAAATATGHTYTWTGNAASTLWSDSGNWTCSTTGSACPAGGTPSSDPGSDVVLPSSLPSAKYGSLVDQSVEVNSLTIDSSLYQVEGSGSFTVDTTSTLQGKLVPSGAVTFNGPVTLAADTTVAGSAVVFDSTVDGAFALMVGGPVTFSDGVGAGTPLTSLHDFQATSLGASIFTTGAQTYDAAVTLTTSSALTASNVSFEANVEDSTSGAHGLTIDGNAVFRDFVGDSVAPASLDVSGTTRLAISANTTGSQTYQGAVTLSSNAIVAGSQATFDSTIDSAGGNWQLSVNGNAVFDGVIGGTAQLGTLYVQGTTHLGTSAITTGGQQLYQGAVTLTAGTTLTANGGAGATQNNPGAVTFDSTVDGAHALTVTADQDVVFLGAVGATTALTTLGVTATSSSAGGIYLDGDSVSTTGTQTFTPGSNTPGSGGVSLQPSGSSPRSTFNASAVTFAGVLVANSVPITVNGSATLTGGATTLASFAVTGSLRLSGGTFTAPSSSDTFTVGGDFNATGATYDDSAGGTLTLDGSGAQHLTTGGSTIRNLSLAGGGTVTLEDPLNVLVALTVSSPGTLDLNGNDASTSELLGDGAVSDGAGSSTLTVEPGAAPDIFAGSISGPVELTEIGAGSTLALTGASDYTGGTTIDGGTVEASTDGSLGDPAGAVAIVGAGSLQLGSALTSARPIAFPGPGPGTIDTQGYAVTLSGPITDAAGLDKVGPGTLTLTGTSTGSGTTEVQAGTLELTGSLAGPLTVENGAAAVVTGTVGGTVTVNSGSLTCDNGGTLNGGPVEGSGATLAGLPGSPASVSAVTGGPFQATVSFSPASGMPCQPVSYRATASPGGSTDFGSQSPIGVGGLSPGASYTFTVTATNPLGSATSSPSNQITTIGPPTISISAPVNGTTYTLGESVRSSFSCADTAGGSGISSCVDQNGHPSGALIDTATLGAHTLTVTADSTDGLTAARTVHYRVLPSNRITVLHAHLTRRGVLRLRLSLPNPGELRIVEWASVRSQKGVVKIFAVSWADLAAKQRGALLASLNPDRQARRDLANHRRLRHVRLVISYTPVGGVLRRVVVPVWT
jgi:autotransporter-associated beta strand protein